MRDRPRPLETKQILALHGHGTAIDDPTNKCFLCDGDVFILCVVDFLYCMSFKMELESNNTS